jgi:prepilin-type processing-associated H-X9-DG protein
MRLVPRVLKRTDALAVRASVRAAFTLTELMVVCVAVTFGVLLVYPALARNRPNGQAFQCLNNIRQLGNAWRTYANDFNDILLTTRNDISGRTNWMMGNFSALDQGAWDVHWYVMRSPIWAYVGPDASIFRCPADPVIVLGNITYMPRVRTYSMSHVFGAGEWLDNTASMYQTVWRTYARGGDIVNPAKTFVFIEEHPESINDASFGNACTGAQPTNSPADAQIIDFPASHHNGAGNLCFADGSAQLHQWQGSKIKPSYKGPLSLNLPAGDSWMDIQWLAQNTTVRR